MQYQSSKIIPAIIIRALHSGEVGVMPTDTLYGIVGSAAREKTVERIYRLRKRNFKKPMIILIGNMSDLRSFGVEPGPKTKKILKKIWPGRVSVVLPQGVNRKSLVARYRYLHRGTKALAFRLPKPTWLRALLRKTGPLVAPSANFEGEPPARTIRGAKRYFGDKVDFYIDMGRLASKPSTLAKIENGKFFILRKGAEKLSLMI